MQIPNSLTVLYKFCAGPLTKVEKINFRLGENPFVLSSYIWNDRRKMAADSLQLVYNNKSNNNSYSFLCA